jgi:small neutral amino acid transporter SnatA (MarC family)
MKRTLRTSSIIALLALISILAQAFSGMNSGFSISAPAIGISGITIVLVLAFAISREDNKSNHKQEQD